MRVEPELTTHIKFKRLKAAVGDCAMECLITIWAHCQQNKRGEYWPGVDATYVEELCNWAGQKGELFRALVECGRPKLGFLTPEGDGLRVHDWEQTNSLAVKNWNRNTAGRGNKPLEADATPTGSQGLPQGFPHRKPTLPGGISTAGEHNPDLALGQKPPTPHQSGTGTGSNDFPAGSQSEADAYPNGSHIGSLGDPNTHTCLLTYSLSQLYTEARRLVTVLNQLTGSSFNPPLPELDQIVSRLQEVQYDFAGVEKMLRHRHALWQHDPKGRHWLKPGTLFGQNFHDYYGQREQPVAVPALKKTNGVATDRTDLLQTLAATRAQLEQNPGDPALTERVRELEAATA